MISKLHKFFRETEGVGPDGSKFNAKFGDEERFNMANIMTTKEIAKYLKLSPITITKYARLGTIPSIRIGGSWRFDKEVIDKWILGE